MRRSSFLLLIALAGCQPAGRYGVTQPRATRPAQVTARAPDVPADVVWMEPVAAEMEPAVPIVFVHQGRDKAAWVQLQDYWTETKRSPAEAAIHFAVWPPGMGMLVKTPEPVVQIKVPLGLDDPTPLLPTANPPTKGKWELGKQLFFDKGVFLQPENTELKLACATCHDPTLGFCDQRTWPYDWMLNTPTLINTVYNKHQFWDGRANGLEEAVQQSLREGNSRHSWGGAVERLRKHPDYPARFRKVFGTPPTEDAVCKALATYMRTILVGNSIHDRVGQDVRTPEAKDYEKVLDDAAVKFLQEPDSGQSKADVAEQLARGEALFKGDGGCIACHGGAAFTDQGFHNLGIGDSRNQAAGAETGRFPVAPIGLKEKWQMGAYKTPTLRALARTRPYFHDGLRAELFDVVAWHVGRAPPGQFIDPLIRPRDLKEGDIRALVMFLRALDGDPIPDVLKK